MSWNHKKQVLACSALFFVPYIVVHGLCIFGFAWSFPKTLFFILMMIGPLGATLGLPIGLIGLRFPKFRERAVLLASESALLLVLAYPVLQLSQQLRDIGLNLAADRAQPVVEAVTRYEEENGKPPSTIEELVPEYLRKIPSQLPKLELKPEGTQEAGESRWALIADVSTQPLDMDFLIYRPNGDYSVGRLGKVYPMGNWALMRE